MNKKNRKILFLANDADIFISHRLPVAQAALKQGCEVILVAPKNDVAKIFVEGKGVAFYPINLSRKGTNPLFELKTIYELYRLYKKIKPDLVHHVTIKPVLYGSIVSKMTGVKATINAITGMGYVFCNEDKKAKVIRFFVKKLYRFGLSGDSTRVIFQNPENLQIFLNQKLVQKENAVLIKGSGVNLEEFTPANSNARNDNNVKIVLASRMLWDKGVGDFVGAAKLLKEKYSNVEFVLAGDCDYGNPSFIPKEQLVSWDKEGVVKWIGKSTNMPQTFSNCDIVCLPSRHEGVPKVLLEAAAAGLPIVASDIPGCKEVVKHGKNGFLVKNEDIKGLVGAFEALINDKELRHKMGAKGRQIAEKEFSVNKVVKETIRVYEDALSS